MIFRSVNSSYKLRDGKSARRIYYQSLVKRVGVFFAALDNKSTRPRTHSFKYGLVDLVI
jgi:hypothetical protein